MNSSLRCRRVSRLSRFLVLLDCHRCPGVLSVLLCQLVFLFDRIFFGRWTVKMSSRSADVIMNFVSKCILHKWYYGDSLMQTEGGGIAGIIPQSLQVQAQVTSASLS